MSGVDYLPVAGFEGYRVGNDGSVWTRIVLGGPKPRLGDQWNRMKPTGKRYLTVNLCNGTGKAARRSVHILVLEAFHGPKPDGMEGRHKNGNAHDNRSDNLIWSTHQDNMDDRRRHGTLPIGERHAMAKLNERDVAEVRKLLAEGMPHRKIAAKFKVSKYPIWAIANNRNWKAS